MNKKIALQLRNIALVAMAVVLFGGYIMQLVSQTPRISFRLETQVSAADISYGAIDTQAVTITQGKLSERDLKAAIENIDIDRKKVQKVERYLRARGAPLADKAEYLVKAAQVFNIDYRLVAAISVVESGGGKHAYRPYNAWGWGGSKGYSFSSWEQGIYTVSKGLARYYANGATTPSAIAPTYNPHTPNEWARKVQSIMNQM